ncbi:MAG: GGDEF domain-containing protein [Chloroflexi bacterium]|nr:GGDEF domain-containing protein [Chloroflexota bacterium]
MAFDLRTIYLSLSLAFFAIAGGLLISVHYSPRALRGARILALSYLLSGVAWGLYLLRGRINTAMIIYSTNLLLVAGVVLLYLALCRLLSLKPRLAIPVIALAGSLVVLVAFVSLTPDYPKRVAWFSIIGALQMLHIAWELMRRSHGNRLASHLLTGAIFFLIGVGFIARSIYAFSGGIEETNALQFSMHTVSVAIVTLVTNVLLPFAFLLISNEQHFARLQQLAETDTLTQSLNRYAVLENLAAKMELASRSDRALSLCMLDLDGFKAINDRHGHSAGDEVLTQIAQQLKTLIRQSDLLGRYGGDEFLVVLPDTNADNALGLANRLRDQVSRRVFQAHGETNTLTLSIGVVVYKPPESLSDLLHRADQAMYRAKQSRNHVSVG